MIVISGVFLNFLYCLFKFSCFTIAYIFLPTPETTDYSPAFYLMVGTLIPSIILAFFIDFDVSKSKHNVNLAHPMGIFINSNKVIFLLLMVSITHNNFFWSFAGGRKGERKCSHQR